MFIPTILLLFTSLVHAIPNPKAQDVQRLGGSGIEMVIERSVDADANPNNELEHPRLPLLARDWSHKISVSFRIYTPGHTDQEKFSGEVSVNPGSVYALNGGGSVIAPGVNLARHIVEFTFQQENNGYSASSRFGIDWDNGNVRDLDGNKMTPTCLSFSFDAQPIEGATCSVTLTQL